MKILVVGSGAREHALAWKLSQEAEVHAAPGNPGIATDGIPCYAVSANSVHDQVELAKEIRPDLVVVGPEAPLIAGLADAMIDAGFPVFGPSQSCAQLEGSKAFAKDFMREEGVATAAGASFTEIGPALAYATDLCETGSGVVVKASGNALGKGVVVCSSLTEAENALRDCLEHQVFGDAGREVVLEQRLVGPEFSLMVVVSGPEYRCLPVVQDYKSRDDGGHGPNTGGMGSFTPVNWVSEALLSQTITTVVEPTIQGLQRRGMDYRGVIFFGLMVEGGVPYCLEYNVRFGDPETQSLVMQLGTGFADLLLAAATGKALPEPNIRLQPTCTIVVASEGYPAEPKTGRAIQLPLHPETVKIFHAGTRQGAEGIESAGGRILSVTAVGETGEIARQHAYAVVDQIRIEGAFVRRDIALS